MPPRKSYAIKGEKHFHRILNDERLKEYQALLQELLFEFPERTDKEVHDALYVCYRAIELELLDRSSVKPKNQNRPPKKLAFRRLNK